MCVRTQCSSCSKPTYAGCGAHIDMVLSGVPTAQRCKCREQASSGAPKKKGGLFGLGR